MIVPVNIVHNMKIIIKVHELSKDFDSDREKVVLVFLFGVYNVIFSDIKIVCARSIKVTYLKLMQYKLAAIKLTRIFKIRVS